MILPMTKNDSRMPSASIPLTMMLKVADLLHGDFETLNAGAFRRANLSNSMYNATPCDAVREISEACSGVAESAITRDPGFCLADSADPRSQITCFEMQPVLQPSNHTQGVSNEWCNPVMADGTDFGEQVRTPHDMEAGHLS